MPLMFGESFLPGVITLRITSLLICTLGFSNLFGTQVLLTYGAEKKLLICTIAGAITNIGLNAVLIPNFAQNGAAVASVVSETLVTTLTIVFSNKYIHLYIEKKFIISLVISALGLIIGVIIVQSTSFNDFMKLTLSVVVGAAIYFVLSYVTGNSVIKDVLSIVKKV
jgi:hypothetical protein